MRVLALDASTHAGWALLEGEPGDTKPAILEHGLIENDRGILEFGRYPDCYVHAATSISVRLYNLVAQLRPDAVVIEETSLGKARYSQKILEFIHCTLVGFLMQGYRGTVAYISSSSWRQALKISLSTEDRKNNAKLSRVKSDAKKKGVSIHEAKKKAGVKGKINKKHVAVRYVNDVYGLGFKVKDNDRADAICLGVAYFVGAPCADGIL